MTLFFGKYRGKVQDNNDPLLAGRLQVSVPTVLGDANAWALPCVPFAGAGVGFFAMPPIGANVWIEFEGGNPDAAIWSGCFWGIGEFPPAAALPQIKTFKTESATLTLSDFPDVGGIVIETADGKKIKIDAHAIELVSGAGASIKLVGSKVAINNTVLNIN